MSLADVEIYRGVMLTEPEVQRIARDCLLDAVRCGVAPVRLDKINQSRQCTFRVLIMMI